MGDAAEACTMLEGGAPIRVLAVLNNERLPGKLSSVPTAKEQGFDIDWPIIRGFYVGPKVSDEQYNWWVQAFKNTQASPEFADLQKKQGLRSEEHTSELQSLMRISYAVFCLKKKTKETKTNMTTHTGKKNKT